MRSDRVLIVVAIGALVLATLSVSRSRASGDVDGNGYLDLTDYDWFEICFSDSGPGTAPLMQGCLEIFDLDGDDDVDLADFAAFERSMGHLPIPLRDTLSNVLTVDSTVPYSGRQTCGGVGCHDIDHISNGSKFQQGRTDVDGNIIMQDDYFGDGRWWQQSPSRYGYWGTGACYRGLASKDNANESEMEHFTTFGWAGECGGCHVGGGPVEFDRHGELLYNEVTGQFGYELLDKTPEDVVYDGDYSYMDINGVLTPGRWDVTGIAEPDCLFCHTPDPGWSELDNFNRRDWRNASFAGRTDLVDDLGEPVPAFAAAGVAGQGWFSNIEIEVQGPFTLVAKKLQIDYSVGVAADTLIHNPDDTLSLSPGKVDRPPRDKACWMCHGTISFGLVRGAPWFDDRFVHYRKFNNLNDDDPNNDIPPERSAVCVVCHPGNLDHNIAKGDSFTKEYRDELDYVNMRTCRDCHFWDSPTRHADAPDVGGGTDMVDAHLSGTMLDKLSCQACHIPYHVWTAGVWAFMDATLTGVIDIGLVEDFYSADPVDPSNPDKSRWYPAMLNKGDVDGQIRTFPGNRWPTNYWADWHQNGTPGDLSDDAIEPIPLWRMLHITGGQPLPGLTDDNGDGRVELNRGAEMLLYMSALKGDDNYSRQVAANPVLVKGKRVWYEDALEPEGVGFFEPEGTGVAIDDFLHIIWALDHNVLPAEESWGYDDPIDPEDGCNHCHRYDGQSPVLDRKVLVDPWDLDGNPVYETVRQMTGLTPP